MQGLQGSDFSALLSRELGRASAWDRNLALGCVGLVGLLAALVAYLLHRFT